MMTPVTAVSNGIHRSIIAPRDQKYMVGEWTKRRDRFAVPALFPHHNLKLKNFPKSIECEACKKIKTRRTLLYDES